MQIRTLLCHGLALLGGFLAGGRLVGAAQAWREWHRWAAADPSAVDLYRTDFWVDLAVAALTLGITGLVYWLLRPDPQMADRRDA